MKGRLMSSTGPVASGPTMASIFNRIDTNQDHALSRAEVKDMVEKAKVGGGIFGGIKVSQATDAFMKMLDTDQDGSVTDAEIQSQFQALMAKLPADGDKTIPERADEWFDKVDSSHDGRVTVDEAKAQLKVALEGQDFADLKAEIGAKIAVYLLDENGNGTADRAEVQSLAEDVAAQSQPAPEPVPSPSPEVA